MVSKVARFKRGLHVLNVETFQVYLERKVGHQPLFLVCLDSRMSWTLETQFLKDSARCFTAASMGYSVASVNLHLEKNGIHFNIK